MGSFVVEGAEVPKACPERHSESDLVKA